GFLGLLRSWIGERIAAGIRRDARPQGGARGRPTHVHAWLPPSGLPADDVPTRRSTRLESGSPVWRNSQATAPHAPTDSRLERSDARPCRPRVSRPDERLRPGLPDADRGT